MPDKPKIDQILLDSDVDWRAWPIVGPPRISSRFTEGLNHKTLLLESSGKKYVLKLFETPSPIAIAAQRWAAKHNLSPKVLYAPIDGRHLLMNFVGGENLGTSETNVATLTAVAGVIRELHGAGINQTAVASGYFNYHGYCDQYLRKCDSDVQRLHHKLNSILSIFTNDKTPLTFCHNDLVLSNCLLHGGQVVLLDWEYAQINNPWFDLASIIYYWQLNKEESLTLLAAYQKGWEEKYEQPIYYAAQCAVLWLDILWHLNKFGSNHYAKLEVKLSQLRELSRTQGLHLDI